MRCLFYILFYVFVTVSSRKTVYSCQSAICLDIKYHNIQAKEFFGSSDVDLLSL